MSSNNRSGTGNTTTIKGCLATIGVLPGALSDCSNLEDEFKVIKKVYFKEILIAHPDKGGDAETFRQINAAFQKIKDAFEKRDVESFASAAAGSKSFAADDFYATEVPKSWDFYYNAAEEEVPLYKVELARSGRSKCVQTKCTEPCIEKGAIRIGSISLISGSYGRWCHLKCWRVPSKIWEGLPDPNTCKDDAKFAAALSSMNEVLLCGFDHLSSDDKSIFIAHVKDKGNWSKKMNRAPPSSENLEEGQPAKPNSKKTTTTSQKRKTAEIEHEQNTFASKKSSSDTMVVSNKKKGFMLVPGKDGAQPNYLSKKTIVMTGIFPEIGGGAGLNLGKDKLKSILESFGAKVTSAVSGRTDFLIVGTQPGASKVSKAQAQPNCKLLTISDMKLAIEGKMSMGEIEAPAINSFSSGYQGNGLAARLGYY